MIPMRGARILSDRSVRAMAEQDYYPAIRDYWLRALSADLGKDYLVAFRHVVEVANLGNGMEQIARNWVAANLASTQELGTLMEKARLLHFLQVDVFGLVASASNPGRFSLIVIEVKDNQLNLSDFGQILVYVLGSAASFGFLLGVNVDASLTLATLLNYRSSILEGTQLVGKKSEPYFLSICKWDTSSGDPLRFQLGRINSIHTLSRFIRRELSVS
jgi:hypothetical protein